MSPTPTAVPSPTELNFSTGTVLVGNALQRLRELPDNSVDSVACDPPYGLSALTPAQTTAVIAEWVTGDTAAMPAGKGFMGKSWDAFVPPPALWVEVLRVLKPGGHLAAFAGTRTVDLMGLSIRLAGFEIRDLNEWIYGTGSPQTGAQKPAHEPILLARKPCVGSCRENVATHGTGALFVDACRVGVAGRWPSNLLLDDAAAAVLDQQSGVLTSGLMKAGQETRGYDGPSRGKTKPGAVCNTTYGDSGGASRFFTRANWEPDFDGDPGFTYCKKPVGKAKRVGVADGVFNHPTTKPVAVMAWLINLLTPPGGVTLDPFLGSGTSAVAAVRDGFPFIGCEMEAEYLPLLEGRIRHAEATCAGKQLSLSLDDGGAS